MKTAIDNYFLGKVREVSANEFSRGYSTWPGRFVCPECGEEVHLSHNKNSMHFSHYQKTKTSVDCDRRVTTNSNISIYEKVGAPIYLREEGVSFALYMGFKTISQELMDRAMHEKVNITISANNIFNKYEKTYMVSTDRFDLEKKTFLPIDFIPSYEQQYRIKIASGTNCIEICHALTREWSNYSDGFTNEGALFSVNGNIGKKIRNGDSISTYTEYYWIRKKEIPSDILGIKMECCGSLLLTNEYYQIFKGQFETDITDEKVFRRLADFLQKNLHVYLLEKPSEVIPIWPPCVKNMDGFSVEESSGMLNCLVKSGNEVPSVYAYYGKNSCEELEYRKLENDVKLIQVGNRNDNMDEILINVDRKNVSNGVYLNFSLFEKESPLRSLLINETSGVDMYEKIQELSMAEIKTYKLQINITVNIFIEFLDGHIEQMDAHADVVTFSDKKGIKKSICFLINGYVLY